MSRKSKSKSHTYEEEYTDRLWREEGEPFYFPKDYGKSNDFFTIKLRANGRFKKYSGLRVYVEGWVRYLDYYEGSQITMLWLLYWLLELGLTGICFLYYKKLMAFLDDGLVHLRTQDDVDEMVRWVNGVKEIGIYVSHPSREYAKSLILGETYNSFRSKWPKATPTEINDVEVRLMGLKEVMLLGWYPNDDRVSLEETIEQGLENVIKNKVPEAAHRFCAKHLHAN
ncbi:hypothetical protein LIER_28926 [Lithospermum erythrorhizon]|uniref:PB1-like domain-containing protein n=1 Tax=Lithospermum erythrorhizon TaxID=34254 RepID=A0AAV3RND6_LITER